MSDKETKTTDKKKKKDKMKKFDPAKYIELNPTNEHLMSEIRKLVDIAFKKGA